MKKVFHKLLQINLQEFLMVTAERQQFQCAFPVYLHQENYDPAKENIFFLHGLGASHRTFEPLQIELAGLLQNANFFSFDFLGFGNNRLPDEVNISFDALASQLKQCLEMLPATRQHIVAHSMGGALVVYALKRYPDLPISSLFNIEGNIFARDCSYSRKVCSVSLQTYKNEKFPKLLQQVQYLAAKGDLISQDWLLGLKECMPEAVHACASHMVQLCDDGALSEAVRQCKRPHLYIFGEISIRQEGKASLDELQRFGIKTATVAGAGHCPMLEAPQATAWLAAEFLRGVT